MKYRSQTPSRANAPAKGGKTFHKKDRTEARHKGQQRPSWKDQKQKSVPARKIPEAKPVHEGVVLWGVHAVREALLNPKRRCFKIWATESGRETITEILTAAKEVGINRPSPLHVDRDEINRQLPPNSVHQGIAIEVTPLAEVQLHEILQADSLPDLIIVLDQVTDPHNVGAILRSAAAFGAGAVIMTERNAPTTTGVMAKTASGAAEHVPQVHVVNLARALKELQQEGYWCIGLAEQGERDLSALDLSGRTALVLGAEGNGLRRLTRENCDELARLPTGGAIGSLNVSNAAAVALYEARRQKKKF